MNFWIYLEKVEKNFKISKTSKYQQIFLFYIILSSYAKTHSGVRYVQNIEEKTNLNKNSILGSLKALVGFLFIHFIEI